MIIRDYERLKVLPQIGTYTGRIVAAAFALVLVGAERNVSIRFGLVRPRPVCS